MAADDGSGSFIELLAFGQEVAQELLGVRVHAEGLLADADDGHVAAADHDQILRPCLLGIRSVSIKTLPKDPVSFSSRARHGARAREGLPRVSL